MTPMGNNDLINFCDPKLCSTVSCNTCCSENYEETNLLSPDPAKLRRGFMADRFIKPPIEIQVIFKYSVNLSHIMLWPRVGQQTSTGFEVVSSYADGNSNIAERIGSCCLTDCDEGVLFFCPRKFGRGISSFDSLQPPKFLKRSLKGQKMSAITDVKSITVKIFRTKGSSVPALGKIEIWGLPGFRTTHQEKKDLWSLWRQQPNGTKPQVNYVSVQQPCAVPGTSKESTLASSSLDIPEEFLDGLTFEIMSVPMVLPSGKVVDQRTLERHQDSEANWGRAPSDPFTGRPFTTTLHPILDTALKSRIDHFLVVHQDKELLRFVPRTLGRKNYCNTAKTHTNVSIASKETTGMSQSRNNEMCSNGCQKTCLSNCTSSVRNPSIIVNSCQPSESLTDDSLVNTKTKISSDCRKRPSSPEVTILSESVCRNKNRKAENNVGSPLNSNSGRFQKDDDLDDALKAVLSGLPSFVDMDKTPQSSHDHCCKCESTNNLFKLPCKHLVCRVCLLEKTKGAQASCDLCQRRFTSNEPVKYHPM